jgi:hypothetical protein
VTAATAEERNCPRGGSACTAGPEQASRTISDIFFQGFSKKNRFFRIFFHHSFFGIAARFVWVRFGGGGATLLPRSFCKQQRKGGENLIIMFLASYDLYVACSTRSSDCT